MDVHLLGPLEVRSADGVDVPLGAPKLRALLVALVLDAGRVVSAERLVEDVWDGLPPARAMVSLRSYVSNLRGVLAAAGAPDTLVTRGRGYRLELSPERVDACRFERLAADGRTALAAGHPGEASALFDQALGLWRGPALADVDHLLFAQSTIARLDELHGTTEEHRLEAMLAAGRHGDVVADADALVRAHPLREGPRRHLMLALHRSGRTPEALDVHRDYRTLLAEELGLDPSPALDALAGRLLRQDPEVDAPTAPSGRAGTSDGHAARGHGRPAMPPPTISRSATGPAGGGATGTSVVARTGDEPGPSRTARFGAGDGPGGGGPDEPHLVGREPELALLDTALERLAVGTGGVMAVGGEPGIGKTALLDALAARAGRRHLPVLTARCLELPGSPPFWPWTQVLRSVAADLDDARLREAMAGHAGAVAQLVPDVGQRIGRRHDVAGLDPASARFALHDAVTTFLLRCAAPQGLVVTIDDLHWSDLASAELVAFMAPQVRAGRILLVVAHRDAEADRTHELELALAGVARVPDGRLVALRGLDRTDVAALVAAEGSEDADGAVAGAIHARTGGNPFFVRQLVALLDDRPDAAATDVPAGVREVVGHRLVALPGDVRETLEVAAVLGQDIDPGVVASCRGRDRLAVLDDLDVARSHGLVMRTTTLTHHRFAHALVRDTLDGELATTRRARLHAEAAGVLAALPSPPVEAVAEHHWQAADLLGTPETVHWLRAAAEEAMSVFAAEQAETYLRNALHLLDHDQAHGDLELAVRLRLVQVLTALHGWTTPLVDEVAGRVRGLAARNGIAPSLVPLWWSLWTGATTRGDLDVASALAAELLAATRANDQPDGLVFGHVATAYVELFRGTSPAVVLDHLDRAAAAERDADPAALGVVPEHAGVALRITRAMAHALRGDAAAAMTAADDAVALATSLGHQFRIAYARLFATWAAAVLDRPDLARSHGAAGLRACELTGLDSVATLIIPSEAWARARSGGDPHEQLVRATAADRALAAAGQRHAVPHGRLLLAELHALVGDVEAADDALASARRLSDEIGENVYDRQAARVGSIVRTLRSQDRTPAPPARA